MKTQNLLLSLVALSVLSFVAYASAGVPQMINYQGVLTDTDGCPVEDTSYAIIFRLYDALTGGNVMWAETLASVTTTQGNFNVLLGSSNPIPSSIFLNDSLWLELEVEEEKMTPRQRIASVGYAFRSESADTADYCWMISDGDWTIDGNNIYREQGNVGIGTTSPQEKLHVAGGYLSTRIKLENTATGGKTFILRAGVDPAGGFGIADVSGGTEPFFIESGASANLLYLKGSNVGIRTTNPTYDLDVDQDARVRNDLTVNNNTSVDGDLDIGGTIKMTFDYSSGWVDIDEGQTITLYHNLGGDESKYIVDLYGKSSDGKIHQGNYGTTGYYTVLDPQKWLGCEWFGLTNSQIKVTRGEDDNEAATTKDWDKCRVRILKNQ